MKRVTAFNERVAVQATRIFGSMWTTYGFFLYGFLPVLLPAYMDHLLYWSNTVQLWSLPLLMVGSAVVGRAGECQARETHDTVMEDRELLLQELTEEREMRKQLAELLARPTPAAS